MMCARTFFTHSPKIMLILGLYCFATVNVCFVPTTAALSHIGTGIPPATTTTITTAITTTIVDFVEMYQAGGRRFLAPVMFCTYLPVLIQFLFDTLYTIACKRNGG